MKNRKVEKKQETRRAAAQPRADRPSNWALWAALGAAAVAAWWAWSAAFHGPFLFDDTIMPFALPQARDSFHAWVGWVRPVTMFTYWISAQISGDDPFAFHVMSVLFHLVASGLVFVIVRRLLEWADAPANRRDLLAAFATAVFLLHPAQAESVAYLAGRAEVVSVMFAFVAFAVFLYRPEKVIGWGRAVAVLALFGLSVLSKEHTIVLPALFLLT